MATWTLPGSCTISPFMFRTHPAQTDRGPSPRGASATHAHTHLRRARAIVLGPAASRDASLPRSCTYSLNKTLYFFHNSIL